MLLLLVLFFVLGLSVCTENDRLIYKQIGHTFSSEFRKFGGIFVYKEDFEQEVISKTNLSPQCAMCYGEAYICGYDNCKWRCITENESCTNCLISAKCIDNCNKCTGFF